MARSSVQWWVVPACPEGDPGVGGDDFAVQVLVADIGPHLLPGAHGGKDGKGGYKGGETGQGQAGSDPEEVLLGDAHVEEAVGKLFPKLADLGRLGQVGGEGDNIFPLLAQLGQDVAVDLRRGHAFNGIINIIG